MLYLTGLFACMFALIHLYIRDFQFVKVLPRSRWLSAAGGGSVAYVFLHILPELSAHQDTLAQGVGLEEDAAEEWIYGVALAGLASFYGLERAAKTSRGRSGRHGESDTIAPEVFWLHIGSFGLYNVLIGYLLLHREEAGLWPLITYFVAMALHFVTSDFGLREHHEDMYDTTGRWIIAGAVLLGWALGILATFPEIVTAFLFAFLAGGIVLNVLKEELPEERKSRFWPFAGGVAVFAALLLAG